MTLFLASTAGLLLSFLIVALLRPTLPAPWHWRGRGVALHVACYLLLSGGTMLILGRPWFATVLVLSLLMLVVQVGNAKYHALRESFVFQDFEYFTDAIRHPRLYIPFLGWWKFLVIALGVVLAVAVGFWLEPAPADRFAVDGQLPGVFVSLSAGLMLLLAFHRGGLPTWRVQVDLAASGLLACLWDYARAERQPLRLPASSLSGLAPSPERPDIVVVQSESFFDARRLYPGIRRDVLGAFDALRTTAQCAGRLRVPAWGANTVRSEFAFLSGVAEAALGVHRFNPYRRLGKGMPSLAARLKAAGYRTVAIHPYHASFYRRDQIFPRLGFDEFIDLGAFAAAPRCGPYVADDALSEVIGRVLAEATVPVFIFVITMENHGPLHLEKVAPGDVPALYDVPPPGGCDDLTIYLRHLVNADRMAGQLQEMLLRHPRAARLCWYGDHVPIMAEVYRQLGEPEAETDYLIWSNRQIGDGRSWDAAAHELAARLLSPEP